MATFVRRALATRHLFVPFWENTARTSHTISQGTFSICNASSPAVSRAPRWLSTTPPVRQTPEETADGGEKEEEDADAEIDGPELYKIVDVDTSIRYMASKAYEASYRGANVWVPYRRNHKGQLPPRKTRKTCIRNGVLSAGNPCPICRDEYLVIHHRNIDLLKQFINPNTGEVLSYEKTGVCRRQHKNLLIAVYKAWDLGFIDKPLTFRKYDYREYYPELLQSQSS